MDSKVSEMQVIEELVPKIKVKWKDVIWQLVATCVAQSIVLQVGINLSYSAILLPQLRNSSSGIVIDDEQASWIASIMTLFSPMGSLAIGPLMEKIGPKSICIVSSIPFVLSWALFALSSNVYHLYIARSLIGFGGGLSNVALVYVSEICHPDFRPLLLGLNSAFISLGILVTAILGLICTWRTIAIICGILVLLSAVGMAFMPESPYWLVAFHDEIPKKRVEKSLHWLYMKKEIYDQQFEEVIKSKRISQKDDKKKKMLSSIIKEQYEMLKDPTVYKPTLILLILFIFQQLSGGYVTIVYAVDVYTKIGGQFSDGIDGYVALVFLGAMRFIISIVSSLISKRIGRRILLNTSCLGMFLSCMVLSLYILYFRSSSTQIIPLLAFLSYISFASLGMLVIPWSLIGELLPVRVKGKIGGLLITTITLMMFVVIKTFPAMMNSCNIETVFLIFALDNVIAAYFVYWYLPETLKKTFTDIENYFK